MDAQAIRPIMNAQQCAELLQCTAETVEELTRKGELPGLGEFLPEIEQPKTEKL